MDADTVRDDVTGHIRFKMSARELDPVVGERMLAALADGADPDYAKLHRAATFIDPPQFCFHTADRAVRDSIRTQGLLAGNGSLNWADKATGQPDGVYVTPDRASADMWTHWPQWDVWQVYMSGLAWQHDRLNPGCFVVPHVPPSRLTLLEDGVAGE